MGFLYQTMVVDANNILEDFEWCLHDEVHALRALDTCISRIRQHLKEDCYD